MVITGLLLLFAQSSYWLNHTIFDRQTFTSIVTPVVQNETTRNAIASTITERVLADRPIVNQLIGANFTAVVAGLLNSDAAKQLTAGLINRSYAYLTTENPQPIAIDLTAIKVPLERITEIIESRGNDVRVNPANIPDRIVLFDPAGLPNIYGYSVLLLWLGPLFWLGFVILAALYIYLGRDTFAKRIYMLGGTIIIASCIGLLVGPLLQPPIVAQVQMPGLRPVADQLIASLLQSFNAQNTAVIVATAIVLIVFYLRFAIVRSVRWTAAKISDVLSRAQPSKK